MLLAAEHLYRAARRACRAFDAASVHSAHRHSSTVYEYSRPCSTGRSSGRRGRPAGRRGRTASHASARTLRTRTSSAGTRARRNPSNRSGNGSHPGCPAINPFKTRTPRAYDTPNDCADNGNPGGSPLLLTAADTHTASTDPSNGRTNRSRTRNHRPNAATVLPLNGNTTSTGSK